MTDLSRRSSRIFLIGFMGSGKSTIGPIVANSIGYDYVDTDRAIEHGEGMRISEIFREKGEIAFREIETAFVHELVSREHTVVSLGGGTILNRKNLELFRKTGLSIYLKSTPEQLFKRLRLKTDRPMLRGEDGNLLSDNQLMERITKLYKEREPVYSTADFAVLTDDVRVGVTVDSIIKLISPHLATT